MSLVSAILGSSGATRAGNAIANANIAAEHGVINNAQAAQSLSSDAFNQGSQNANAALGSATGMVNDATGKANDILGSTAATQTGNAQPFMAAGQTGIGSLSDLLKSYGGNQPQFSFNYEDYKNDPAYQFQLQQGAAQRTLARSADTRHHRQPSQGQVCVHVLQIVSPCTTNPQPANCRSSRHFQLSN